LIALGTGGIKSNVSPFGAQQVAEFGPQARQSFFNWFYWFINIGSMISLLVVAYVQQNISYFYGFIIIFVAISLAILVFVIPKQFYKMDEVQ